MDSATRLLKELTEATGVSAHEREIRRLMTQALKPITDDIRYDRTDYDNTIKLVTEVIRKLDARTVKSFMEA